MDTAGHDTPEWSRDTLKLAVLSWLTFLGAAAASVVVFAFLDPLVLVDALNVAFIDGREAGYAVGFFFLWAYAWITGWFVLRLVRRKRQKPRLPRPKR